MASDRAQEVPTRSDFSFNPLEGWSAREIIALAGGFLLWLLLVKTDYLPDIKGLASPLTGIGAAFLFALVVRYSTRRPQRDAVLR